MKPNPLTASADLLKSIAAIGLILSAAACASKHPGRMAEQIHGQTLDKMVVSAKRVPDLATKSFEMIEVTVENTGDGWQRFSRADVVLAPDEKNLSVVVGEDLKTWGKAYAEITKLNEYNAELAKGSIALGSALIASTSGDKRVKTAGLATMATVAAVDVTSEIQKGQTNASSPSWVPESHLHTPFSVPGGLFVRKWVLLNKPSTLRMKDVVIRLHGIDNQTYDYIIKL